jgi:hypothetical protein
MPIIFIFFRAKSAAEEGRVSAAGGGGAARAEHAQWGGFAPWRA